MITKLTTHIETTALRKDILPWTALQRRGRHAVDTQLFALVGYPEKELRAKDKASQEAAYDQLQLLLRHLTAFEYIPSTPDEIDAFFEKKLVALERSISQKNELPLNLVVGITYGTRILFAVSGEIVALQISSIQITPLHDGQKETRLHFDTFRSGEVNARSHILFLPKSMAALIKSSELKQLTLVTSSGRKLEYFEHLWQKRSTLLGPFCAILLEGRPKAPVGSQTTSVSIGHLINTENQTEELLSPPLLRPLILKSQAILKKSWEAAGRAVNEINERFVRQSSTAKDTQTDRAETPLITQVLKNLHSKFKSAQIREKQRVVKALQTLPTQVSRRVNPLDKFNSLPNKSKLFLIFGIIFLFVFTESILLTGRARAISYAQTEITQETQEIQKLIDSASGALIYNDEEGARANLIAAGLRIEKLPDLQKQLAENIRLKILLPVKGSLNQEKIAELAGALLPIKQKLERAIILETLSARLDLSELLPDAKGLLVKDGIIFAYAGRAIVRLEKDVTQKIDITLPTSEGEADFALTHETKDTLILISGKVAYLYNTQLKTLGNAALLQDNPKAAASYRRRFYTLDTTQGQIYKYEPASQGFRVGQSWITDGTVVSDGRALAIDGFVYVLNDKGEVTEFLRGAKRDFHLKGIDPVFENTTALWTDENSDYLYILEPSQKRLAVFGKTDGVLKVQYQSPAFENLKDFAVDESAKVAYLLSGVKILSIPLPHLN